MRRRLPFVMGYDVVGDIDQLGDGVRGFQFGDRVADMTVIGSNAAYRTLRADRLTRVPASVDPAEAATLILSWTTAYQLLHRAARCSLASARSYMAPPALSGKRCSCSAGWPASSCGALRAARMRR
jgi:NADPH:quinone reductase-like Zn-dependent oxidoreductase